MDGSCDEGDCDLLDYARKGLEEGNPEVVSVNSEPSDQVIQVNDELPSVIHGLDMVADASNNQHLLNSNPSYTSQEKDIGKQNSSISNDNINNINRDATKQMEVRNTHGIFKSQETCVTQENMKTEQAFLLNSKLGDRHEFDMRESANYQVPNDMLLANAVHAPHRMRNVSHDPIITHTRQAQNRSKHEICEMTGQVLSTYSEDGGKNYSLATDINLAPSQMEFDNSRLTGNYHEFSNSKERRFHNKFIQEHCDLSRIIGQNNASNVNIFLSPQNATATRENSYSGGAKLILGSDVDNLAVAGPSGILQKKYELNLSEDKLQSISTLEQDSGEVDEKMLICKYCKKEIAKHGVAYQGRNFYECCLCFYKSEEKDYLRMHTLVYPAYHWYCNVCKEVYTECGSHDRVRTCNTCNENFLCRGLLEQHSEGHEDYYDVYCRLCGRDVNNTHKTKEAQKTLYVCCRCEYTNKSRQLIQNHFLSHSDLQLFKCYVCNKRFKHRTTLLMHLQNKHQVGPQLFVISQLPA